MQEPIAHLDYVTQEGDQFDAIALSAYSEERMSSYIIQANPDMCAVLIFDAGVHLKIPVFERAEASDSLPPWRRGE